MRPVSSDEPPSPAPAKPAAGPESPAAAPSTAATPRTDGWATYQHAKTDVTLEYPAHWIVGNRTEGSIAGHLRAPDQALHFYVTAFIGASGLEEFAKAKFESQPEIFRAAGPAKPMEGPGWKGLIQEADDTREGRPVETRRIVLCAVHGELFVALSLYAEQKELTQKREYYDRLFTSLRFTGVEAPRHPPGHQHH
jgi:hypothetical protein